MGTLNTNEYEITITETHSITIYAPNAEEANDRVSDMLGHLTKEKKEEQIEGVFALSDGDIKKLATVRKSIAETTYGTKDNRNEEIHTSSRVQE